MASFGPLQRSGGVALSNFDFAHLSIHANINLCLKNSSHLTLGLFGAQVRFFLFNIFVSKNDTNEYQNLFI